MCRRVLAAVFVVAFGMSVSYAETTGAMRRRTTRCCLALEIPGVPPGPVCAHVRGRGGIGPRRACRLLGGRVMGRGDCNPAVCAAEPA